ncbi:uroporphyrinogen-III synthase [Helicobacter suis]|uniref:uroporphyrinogen-III synthase n=1 Tax=Helicobacter suis TaxID=104628 RepID=UPI001F199ACC|nr:uroporphyrinogen-III synthase [Helicobacter suis]
MRPIVVVGMTPYVGDVAITNLICSEIIYLPLVYKEGFLSSTLSPPLFIQNMQALLFTSKHAPLALTHSLETKALDFLKTLPVFVLAEKSAQVAKDLGFCVAFVGQGGHAKDLLQEITLPRNTLFVRAKEVASSVFNHLPSLIVYESKPLKLTDKPKPHSVLIFSAPSAYKIFCYCFSWDNSYTAIALGESTFETFGPNIHALKSPKPRLQDCITLAKTL